MKHSSHEITAAQKQRKNLFILTLNNDKF